MKVELSGGMRLFLIYCIIVGIMGRLAVEMWGRNGLRLENANLREGKGEHEDEEFVMSMGMGVCDSAVEKKKKERRLSEDSVGGVDINGDQILGDGDDE